MRRRRRARLARRRARSIVKKLFIYFGNVYEFIRRKICRNVYEFIRREICRSRSQVGGCGWVGVGEVELSGSSQLQLPTNGNEGRRGR